MSERKGDRLLCCFGTEKLRSAWGRVFDLLLEDGVDDLHGAAELTETASHKVFFSTIDPEPKWDRADRFHLKNRFIRWNDVIREALIVWLQRKELGATHQSGVESDAELAIRSHEGPSIVAKLDGWFKFSAFNEIKELCNDHALSTGPVTLDGAENVVVSVGELDCLFNGKEKPAFGAESEMLMFDFDETGGRNLAAFHAVYTNTDLATAGQSAVFLPETLTVRSFKVLRDNWVIPVFRSQAVNNKPIGEILLDFLHVVQADQILVFGAVEAQG